MKRSRTLVFLILVVIIGIVAFLVLRKGDVSETSQPVKAESQSKSVNKADSEVSTGDANSVGDANSADDGDSNDVNEPDCPNEPAEPNCPNEPAEPMEALNLKDVPFNNIIQKLAEWTGKVIIPADEVMQQKFTIYSAEELPRSQALNLVYSALLSKGFIAEHSDKVIFIKPIKNARLGSVPIIAADQPLAQIENKQQVVQKFFRLENYSPSQMSEIILPLIGEYGYVSADENAGSLLVIDTVENLMRFERMIRQFDIPEAEQTVTEIFEIENGDPGEIVQLLRILLTDGSKSGRRGRSSSSRPSKPPSGNGQQGEALSVVIESTDTPIVLVPDARRKWIIAKASPEDIKELTEWIEKLDREQMVESESEAVSILYADVREVASSIEQAMRSTPGSELKTSVLIRPLPQARQILIFGRPEVRDMVKKLIAEVDMPTGKFDTEVFKLQHADPDQVKKNLDDLYGDENQGRYSWYYRRSSNDADTVKVISFPSMQQVTVIASPENMEKIRAQVVEWDVPINAEKVKPKIIELHNSDPVRLSDLLSKLFSEESDSRSSFWEMIFGRGMKKEKIVGPLYGQLTFEAVPDTKKIIVISKIPQAYDVIEDLIEELDSMEIAELPMVVTLNYADSEELCDQLNAILNEPGTPASLRRRERDLSEYSMDDGDGKSSGGANNQKQDSAGVITPWWTKARSKAGQEMPTSNLIGRIRFIPVQRSKAILVLSPTEYQESLREMIHELDQPGKQVMVKAIIVQMDHSEMTSLGIEISSNAGAFGTIGENAATALTELSYLETHGAWTLSASTSVNTLVDLLIKEANARVLNQPTLWTKDNEEAEFFKGQNVAFIEGSQTDTTGAAVKTTFNYRDVGVTLRVRPNITPEKNVGMNINLIISQVEPDLINGQIATNKLDTTTHLIVEDGQTIMLGGILFQTDSQIDRKIPLLGDLPLLGDFFHHYDTQIANNELLVFITPYVVDDQSSAETVEQMDKSKQKLDEIVEQLGATVDGEEEIISKDVVEVN